MRLGARSLGGFGGELVAQRAVVAGELAEHLELHVGQLLLDPLRRRRQLDRVPPPSDRAGDGGTGTAGTYEAGRDGDGGTAAAWAAAAAAAGSGSCGESEPLERRPLRPTSIGAGVSAGLDSAGGTPVDEARSSPGGGAVEPFTPLPLPPRLPREPCRFVAGTWRMAASGSAAPDAESKESWEASGTPPDGTGSGSTSRRAGVSSGEEERPERSSRLFSFLGRPLPPRELRLGLV